MPCRIHDLNGYEELISSQRGFPGGSDGKQSACNAGDWGSIPGSGRSPREGNGNPSSILAYWTEEPGGLQSMGCKESDTTEQLTPASSQRKGASQDSPEIVKIVMAVHSPLH